MKLIQRREEQRNGIRTIIYGVQDISLGLQPNDDDPVELVEKHEKRLERAVFKTIIIRLLRDGYRGEMEKMIRLLSDEDVKYASRETKEL